MFLKQLSQEHANSVHSVHLYAAQILSLDPKFFKKNWDHVNTPEIKELLYSPRQPDAPYPLWPTMLFPHDDVDRIHVFRCPSLMTVRIALLCEL
ncbi:hypothetical protein EI94DRAFT_1761008 [Lactarius quietus]|nr:hypothetical protein EI94DRAFT_1761008 [Lactarius quietus]